MRHRSPLHRRFSRVRRRLFEAIGSDRYSRPSINDLDRKLEPYLGYRNGVFVEAGAHDGFSQSNTYYLERLLGWSGILIEPIPELYECCVRERSASRVFNCALVASDDPRPTVTMRYAGLMSLVPGARGSEEADRIHVRHGAQLQDEVTPYTVEVPTATLTQVLTEANVDSIEFLSLDVEGYEVSVLRGIDFSRFRPRYMLIEATAQAEVTRYVRRHGYALVNQLSHHDFLFESK